MERNVIGELIADINSDGETNAAAKVRFLPGRRRPAATGTAVSRRLGGEQADAPRSYSR